MNIRVQCAYFPSMLSIQHDKLPRASTQRCSNCIPKQGTGNERQSVVASCAIKKTAYRGRIFQEARCNRGTKARYRKNTQDEVHSGVHRLDTHDSKNCETSTMIWRNQQENT